MPMKILSTEEVKQLGRTHHVEVLHEKWLPKPNATKKAKSKVEKGFEPLLEEAHMHHKFTGRKEWRYLALQAKPEPQKETNE